MVKTVTMDLNCYYPIVARELFPNAQIVIDRFHMVQMLTRSFNSLRVQTMKQFKKQSREYKLLKATLLRLAFWRFGLNCNKDLENTYWVMQSFMTAIQNKDETQIIHLLHSKQAIGKQMHQPLLTFKRNYTDVLNGVSSNWLPWRCQSQD